LKQPQYEPVSLEHQVILLFAGTNGFTDHIPVEHMRAWQQGLLRSIDTSYPEINRSIAAERCITDENEERMREAIKTYNAGWSV